MAYDPFAPKSEKEEKVTYANIYDETDVVASDVERDNEISQLEAGLFLLIL